ncbi:hypothetical protein K0M31_007333, partial [Melipona bicolor]
FQRYLDVPTQRVHLSALVIEFRADFAAAERQKKRRSGKERCEESFRPGEEKEKGKGTGKGDRARGQPIFHAPCCRNAPAPCHSICSINSALSRPT